jgi:glycogen synthase
MRVLTLTNGYPPHYYGGYELTCFDVMQRFMETGHDVTVLTSTARVPGVDESDRHDVRRTLIPYWDWETNRRSQPTTPLGWSGIERHNLAQLAAALRDVRPDIISVWHMIGLSMSLLTLTADSRLPTVVTVGNDWLIQAPDFDPWHRLWRSWPASRPRSILGVPTQLASLRGARINFVSDFIKQRAIVGSPWPVDPGSPIIEPGIDLADFPITERVPPAWSWRLLYVGRVDPVKGVATLIRAFALLPPSARLAIVGGGPHTYVAEMKALAAQLGVSDRVSFSRCPRSELRQRYLDSDVLVFPSEWDEPFGLVPIEAMACGVPVVATATGGAAEFLRDQDNCLLFPARDAAALAAAVTALSADRPLVETLAANGPKTATKFTIDRYAERLLDLHTRATA